MSELKMCYVGCGPVLDENGEDYSWMSDPEGASEFVRRQIQSSGNDQNLVPVSVKLSKPVVDSLDNNSQVLGMSKSEFHRKALEIGINEITRAYCELTNQDTYIKG